MTACFSFYFVESFGDGCFCASISESKKAVSDAAPVVVGIGLLTAPIDSAQANHGDIPLVLSVDIYSSSRVGFSLTHDWPNGHCGVINPQSSNPPVPYKGGYFQVNLYPFVGLTSDGHPVCSASEWIELWVWLGDDDGLVGSNPYAYVYDSKGNFYYVDIYIDGYGPLYGPR